ncbi:MAG: helix-turn-helix domain-containing protein, partial [Clostridium sp.]|nr:helix-turn-helix domain-containing protein [Clostridium sp.]
MPGIGGKDEMTSKELAKLLGVSQSTVYRSLNGSSLVKGETAERIRAVAKE